MMPHLLLPATGRFAGDGMRTTFTAAILLVGIAIARVGSAQEFLTPAQCKGVVKYRDNLGRQALRAAQRYDAFNGSKQILKGALAEARSDLTWAGGTVGDLRRAAFIIQKVCEATSHTIAGLTPEGAVMGSIEEAAADAKDTVVRLIQTATQAKEMGEKIQNKIHGGEIRKRTAGEEFIDAATSDKAVELVRAIAKEKGYKYVGPIARNVAELWKAQAAVRDAMEAGKLEGAQRAFEATAKQAISSLEDSISAYQAAMHVESDTLDAIESIHRGIDAEVLSSCSTKVCDDAERAAKGRRDEAWAKADELWKQAQELRRDGPDLSSADKEMSGINEELRALQADVGARADALDKKIRDLIAERAAALDELRRGVFCSKCRRTASEIERTEQLTFQAHLGTVKGSAVPATQKEIAKKAAEYDNKIESLKRELDGVIARYRAQDKGLRDSFAGIEMKRRALWDVLDARIKNLEDSARATRRDTEKAFAIEQRKAAKCRAGYEAGFMTTPSDVMLARGN